jgi:hypothetical protein
MFAWLTAILRGALAPALIVAGLSRSLTILTLAYAITLGHAIIIGLPVALLYRAKRWMRLSATIAGAFIIGAVPGGLLPWPVNLSFRTSASVDGVTTIINGVPTLAGWLGYLKVLGMLGGLGALGGLVFWLTLRSSGALAVAASDLVETAPRRHSINLLFGGAALAVSAAIFALPTITQDRSCHNMFRDGRRSVSSQLNIDLAIAASEWSRLAQLLEDFAVKHGMSYRNASEERPGTVKVLGISACTEKGLVITANEQLWNTQISTVLRGDRGVGIGVYDLHDGKAWPFLAKDLVATLEAEWNGKVRFRDGSGRFIPPPAVLMPDNNSTR